jgi:hypothetical protein
MLIALRYRPRAESSLVHVLVELRHALDAQRLGDGRIGIDDAAA